MERDFLQSVPLVSKAKRNLAIGNNQSSVKSFRMCHRSHKSRVTKVQNTSQKLQVTGHTSCKPVPMGLISVTLLGAGEGEGRGGRGECGHILPETTGNGA